MVRLQGGDPSTLADTALLPHATLVVPLESDSAGVVSEVNADRVGRAVLLLGGGRTKVTDTIDPAVGIANLCKVGDRVTSGQCLLNIHANDSEKLKVARDMVRRAIRVSPTLDQSPPALIVETIRPEDL